MKSAVVVLKPGTEKQTRRYHPWVFAGAIREVVGQAQAGDLVEVRDAEGNGIGWGYFHPRSQIRVRLVSRQTPPGEGWLEERLERALVLRRPLLDSGERSVRLVFSEADGLPGLIVDLLGPALVLQADTLEADRWVEPAATFLRDRLADLGVEVRHLQDKSDGDGRALEGLEPRQRWLAGETDRWPFTENGLVYFGGDSQKTGHFIDQRESRLRLRAWCRSARVLDGFCHTGGMGLNALAAGAREVCFVDQSEHALELARANLQANGFGDRSVQWLRGDVFRVLRDLRSEGRQFDVVVLDPPRFAVREEHLGRAKQAYKDLAVQALSLLREGGVLALFSCSSHIKRGDLVRACAFAAWDLRVDAYVVDEFRQSSCHPVPLWFPQAEYLHGVLVQKGHRR